LPITLKKAAPTTDIKKSKAVLPQFLLNPGLAPRRPQWNYPLIYRVSDGSWLLQEIYKVKIQEVKRAGFYFPEKFKSRCEKCDLNFQDTTEDCPICGEETRSPDIKQLSILRHLTRNSRADNYVFGDVLGSIVYHDDVADDWYASINPLKRPLGNGNIEILPGTLSVQHSAFIKIVADEFGNIGVDEEGNAQYYCPICYDYKDEYTSNKPKKCPICGMMMEPTAYVQIVGNDIKARWSTRWMIHGSTGRILPSLYGTPKIYSCWEILYTLRAMDQYMFDAYTEGKLAGIINFPGYKQEQVTELQVSIETDIKKRDVQTPDALWRSKKSPRQLMIGSEKPITFHKVMPDLTAMQSLSYYMVYTQAVCGLHGVTPISISLKSKELGGGPSFPQIELEVQNKAMKEVMRDKEEVFNAFLLPRYGVTDYLFKFNPLEMKDELREAQIRQTNSHTLMNLRNMGFDVYFNEHGKLVIPTKPTLKMDVNIEVDEEDDENPDEEENKGKKKKKKRKKRPKGASAQKPKISESTGAMIEGTSTERYPYGPRGRPE